jgi:hypothetical protein
MEIFDFGGGVAITAAAGQPALIGTNHVGFATPPGKSALWPLDRVEQAHHNSWTESADTPASWVRLSERVMAMNSLM